MKRLFSLIAGMVAILTVMAQDATIGYYSDDNGNHPVVVRLKDKEQKIDCVFICVSSTMGDGYFRVDNNKISELVSGLITAKSKLEEWSKQATENGIENFTKQMNIDFPKVVVYLSGKPNFNFSQKPTALFQVDKGVSSVWIYTNTTTNFTKYNNKKEVFTMQFEKPSDIGGLISLLQDQDALLRLTKDQLQNDNKIDGLFQ